MHWKVLQKAAGRLTATSAAGLAVMLAASIFVVWAFAELADEIAEGESRQFDRSVLLWIHTAFPDWLETPMRLVTALGYYWVVLPLAVGVAYLFHRRGARLSAALLFISTTGGALLTTALKAIFERTRPELFDTGYTASFYSFPSGHATFAVGFYGALALLLAIRLKGPARWLVIAAGVVLILLIGLSRLYLGVHWPTDVLAGYLAAPLWLVGVGAVYVMWRLARGGS